ncbi:MAG: aminotransferase class I and II [Desulfobacteraceae bacterium 4572_35.1]|nr:MAG: aminotransferase class I and II [Desulfobacteraceae bacterium 4572_35.1]
MKISPQLQQVNYPPISEVKQWISGREFSADAPLVDLCQAIPDYQPADGLINHLQNKLTDPSMSVYSPDEGLLTVRQSVSAWYERRYGAGPNEDQICMTMGASQAFWLAMLTLCQSGDEVIVQLPAYFDHPMGLQALGIKPRYLPYDGATGMPDPQKIAAVITSKTKAILLVTPSNPTGTVLPPALIDEIYQLAKKHDIALVLDETYNAFLPGETKAHQLFEKVDWGENFIHIASFGKTFALTGYRAGALVASAEFIYHALKVQDSMVVCQPRITQQAIAYGCDNLDRWVEGNASMMQQRHDRFFSLFNVSKNPFTLCASGAFFAWVKHPWTHLNGRQAARKMADDYNVICLPGEVFGPHLDDYLRLAFGNVKLEQIELAVERFYI